MKIVEGKTDVTINTGTFSNSVVIGGDMIRLAANETKVNFYRTGNTKLTITGGNFTVTTPGGQRTINGGLYYNAPKNAAGNRVPIGSANLTGNVNLTISGGTFKGYDVYGGNSASAKSLGKYTTIDGNVTIKLDASKNALVFAQNDDADQGGKIYAGSFGAGAINGNVEVILKGTKGITYTSLFGGCTGDIRNAKKQLESNVAGDRILTFTGFEGKLDFDDVVGFSKISIDSASKISFETIEDEKKLLYANNDVVNWSFAYDATINGAFAFDFNSIENIEKQIIKDSLEITGADFESGSKTFLADCTVANFDKLGSVTLLGEAAAFADGAWTSDSYKLTVGTNNTGMSLAAIEA